MPEDKLRPLYEGVTIKTMAEHKNFQQVSMDWDCVLEFAFAWEDSRMHPGIQAEWKAQQEKPLL
jgi:hypothetical protein